MPNFSSRDWSRSSSFELAGDPRAVVKEIAGSSLLVDEAALVKITIDRLKDRDAAGSLLNRQALCRRELERLG
jgi:hypothetical protein